MRHRLIHFSLLPASAMADTPAVVNPLGMAPYLRPSARWARRLPCWGPRIHGSTPPVESTFASADSSVHTNNVTFLHDGCNPFL
jgi:hypothetical protein